MRPSKHTILPLIFVFLISATNSFAGLHFGISSAVKAGVQELRDLKDEKERNSHIPEIVSLTADSASLTVSNSTTVTCVSSYTGQEQLSYIWHASGGTVAGSGPSITWTAPSTAGTYRISCMVSDGHNDSDTKIISIIAVANQAPSVTSLTAASSLVTAGEQTTFSCIASDPENASLTYSWTASGGTITGTGANITWTAPSITGTYKITCIVFDGINSSVGVDVNIVVNAVLSITSLTSDQANASIGELITVTAVPSETNSALVYTWTASGGTMSGTNASAIWTAPTVLGQYTISCVVSDGHRTSVKYNLPISVINKSPSITSLTADHTSISINDQSIITCTASDPENSTLTYEWLVSTGVISGTGHQITWTAPSASGAYNISCIVSDGVNTSSSNSVRIYVDNDPPVISSLTADDTTILTDTQATLTCVASDPENASITYTWAKSGGTIIGTSSTITWTAPSTAGTYTVSCAVSDGVSSSATSTVSFTVTAPEVPNRAPAITSIVASPAAIEYSSQTSVTCNASDADNDTITYLWVAYSGTIIGTSSTITWTAPVIGGTYKIYCSVTDGELTSSQQYVEVVVDDNDPPIIASVTASDGNILISESTTVTCTASDPEGVTVTYAWTATDGTITGSGSQITWTAPAVEGTCTISCSVSDGTNTTIGTTNVVVSGDSNWTAQFGGSLADYSPDYSQGIMLDASGHIFLTGYTYNSLYGNTNQGLTDAYIAKYDNSTRIWIKQLGTSNYERGEHIVTDLAGNAYISGYTYGSLTGYTNQGQTDVFLAKYNTSGTLVWHRQFGGVNWDESYGLSIDSSDNIYISGYTENDLDSNPGTSGTIFLAKYNTDGTCIWTKQFGSDDYDYPNDIAVDLSGNIFIGGYTYGSFAGNTIEGTTDGFVVKCNSSGTVLWAKQFGVSDIDLDYYYDTEAYGLETDASGNVYVTGWTDGNLDGNNPDPLDLWDGDPFLVKYDSSGTKLWTVQHGSDAEDYGSDVGIDSSGNAYIIGATYGSLDGNTNQGYWDILLTKYNSSGAVTWTQQFGSSMNDHGYGIYINTSGSIFMFGDTFGGLNGNTNSGSRDVFLWKYTR